MGAEAQRCARATIEYDGTAFAGSQVQPNARTVQGELEEALNRLIGEGIRVRLAGRTDAGVHATGQVAAFCLPRALPWSGGLPELRRRLNAVLPPDLAVRALSWAPPGFDPRRDALWRVYRYRIRTEGDVRALERHRTVEIDDRLDVGAMRAAAERLVGERDFAALGSNAHGATVRHLSEVRVTRRGNLVEIRVTANAFLQAHGPRDRGGAPRGRSRPARAGGGHGAHRTPGKGARRTGGTGPRAHARARHLPISQIDNRTKNDQQCAHEGASQGMTGEQET